MACSPEHKRKLSEALKAAWARSDVRERIQSGQKRAWTRPEAIANKVAAACRVQSDPSIRAKKSAAMKIVHTTPASQERYRAAYARPEVRAKMSLAHHRSLGQPTRPELALLKALDKRRFKYAGTGRRLFGQPISADIVAPALKLIIQVDGCYWHNCKKCGFTDRPWMLENDQQKTSFARSKGWRVLRFWEHDIQHNLPRVLYRIQLEVGRHAH